MEDQMEPIKNTLCGVSFCPSQNTIPRQVDNIEQDNIILYTLHSDYDVNVESPGEHARINDM
jgi:hypothetical protein